MTRLNPITTPRHQLRATKAQNSRETALAAFLSKKGEIDTLLARLQALSDDHFNTAPGEVNWGHVGTPRQRDNDEGKPYGQMLV